MFASIKFQWQAIAIIEYYCLKESIKKGRTISGPAFKEMTYSKILVPYVKLAFRYFLIISNWNVVLKIHHNLLKVPLDAALDTL